MKKMKWRNRAIIELSGTSLKRDTITLADAINRNARVLREAVQKIEELNKQVEELRGQVKELKRGGCIDK